MSKESKKYANPVRKAKYEDDGVKDAPIILFREPGRKPAPKSGTLKRGKKKTKK